MGDNHDRSLDRVDDRMVNAVLPSCGDKPVIDEH
jgi:hypothetical protein